MCVGTILFKIISDNAHTKFYYNHKRVHGSSRKLICSERTIKLVNSMKTYEIVHLFMTQTLYTYLTKEKVKEQFLMPVSMILVSKHMIWLR